MPITSTIQQGTLSLAAVTPGNSAIGDAAAAGTSASVARADHKHGREASGTPGASAVGDTASTGSATTVALSDHRHSREAFGTPGAVTGGATAASGSALTLARSDHVHSTAGMPVLLASTTLGSAAASITFRSITSIYTSLLIFVNAKTVSTNFNSYVGLRFNGDASAAYPNNEQGVTTSPYTWGYFMAAQGSATQIMTGSCWAECTIHGYASTSNVKWCYGRNVANAPTTSSNYQIIDLVRTFVWNNTSAITSITILDPSNNLVAGSSARLYGIP